MDVGFLVLCPNKNATGLKISLGSINNYSYNREAICVVGDNANDEDAAKLGELCPIHKGGNTLTSLINVGMKQLKHDWAFILFSGSKIPKYLERKFDLFVKNDSDVLFPVVDRKCNFVEGSFNGVMINTKFFKKIGDFQTSNIDKDGFNDFEFTKMLWAIGAINQGATFKGIVGMKII
jgi:hypothetical protein